MPERARVRACEIMLCTEMGEGCLRDLAETIQDPIKEHTAIVSRLP
jgi:hypothetical protein